MRETNSGLKVEQVDWLSIFSIQADAVERRGAAVWLGRSLADNYGTLSL